MKPSKAAGARGGSRPERCSREIFAETETKFFLKVVDAQVEFIKDASGTVTGIVLNQGGRQLPGKKIK